MLFRPFACLVIFFASISCRAQRGFGDPATLYAATYDFDRDRLPVIALDGAWRFQRGDDPDGTKGWAASSFDDSRWQIVHAGRNWTEDPQAAFAGPAWFRAQIKLAPGKSDLSVFMPSVFVNYQLYADGKLVGGSGAMPPSPSTATNYPRTFSLPQSSSPRSMVIALRVWRWPQWNYFYKFALPDGIMMGNTHLLERKRASEADGAAWSQVSTTILLIVELLFGIAALVLFFLRPSEYANLWFGIMLVIQAFSRTWGIWPRSHLVEIATYYVVLQLLSSLTRLVQLFFYFFFLKGKQGWLFWFAVATASLIAVADYPLFFPAYFPARLAAVPIIAWTGLISALQAAPSVWILTLLFQRAREGREDARLLLVPVILIQTTPILYFIAYWGFYGFSWTPAVLARLDEIAASPFSFSYYDVVDALFLTTMLAILIRRFVRTAAREEDHQRERDAARIVQHVLLPEETPVVPGFEIQSIYLPFGEVGGDFFQIVPQPDLSVLVAIGDVSGKGLPAAMTVALLVGTFRAVVMYNREPAEILSLMNQCLTSRESGGFTTCVVLRADPDGTLTVANAGHLPPYLDGEELFQDCDLPLGLVQHIRYAQQSYRLGLNSRLTLLTDGVVEARSNNGELFGFARTADLARQSAEEIARSAKEFGQDDDITVLNLIRVA